MELFSWLTQPLLVDLPAVSEQCQQELCELQKDESVKTLFKIKGTTMWLSEECEKKYPHLNTLARQKLISRAIYSHKSHIFFCASGSYETNFITKIAPLRSL